MAISSGKYAKFISDRSGQEFPYSEMVIEWNGARVHISEFEKKHPQLEPRPIVQDPQSLEDANAHYTNFEAFKTKSVFSFTNTVGPTGGVLYYETGFARPDLVLKDLIKIGHPELLNDYEPYFFKPLK